MVSLLLVVIYIVFISLGLPDSLLGAGWPSIHAQMGVPLSYLGIITMIVSAGTIISSLMSERLNKKIGTKYVILSSVALTAVALVGYSFSSTLWMFCLWAIPYGLGAGAIDAALNNYVSLHYSSRQMSWLHCFWGVGTIISPYLMSYAIKTSAWNDGFRYVAFIQIAIVILIILSLPLWKINKTDNDIESIQGEYIGLKGSLKIKGVIYLLIGFFAYCSAEATLMGWSSSYFVNVRGFSDASAASLASLFFIGITIGRFISGFVSDVFEDRNMIRVGTVVFFIGILLILLPISNSIPSIIGFIIAGLGCAPIYPSIIHATPSNFGEKNSQAIIGVQMASAYLGATFMPPLFGIIGQFISMQLLPYFCSIFFILMIIILEKTFKITSQNCV